jgi:hypothetical protein
MASKAPERIALFDESHGQANWQQTGFTSRLIETNFSGLARILRRIGLRCVPHRRRPLDVRPGQAELLVIPPPTGLYDAPRERWLPSAESRLLPTEICALVEFVASGGSLMLFGYRFGDSFLQSNLGELCAAFGCLLNDDAVVDVRRLGRLYPLTGEFVTGPESIVPPWAAVGVRTLRWRSMATFTLLPGSGVIPLVISPGGPCPAYNRRHRHLTFQSKPIAVIGELGLGRFVFFGGPHAFETGPTGLLHAADNHRLLENVLSWLTRDDAESVEGSALGASAAIARRWQGLCEVANDGTQTQSLLAIERALGHSQTLRALPRWKWKE